MLYDNLLGFCVGESWWPVAKSQQVFNLLLLDVSTYRKKMSEEWLFKVVMRAKNKAISPCTRSIPVSQYHYLSNKPVFVDKASVQEWKVGTA